MIYDDDGVFAINDSGNGAIIYYLNKNDFSIISKYKPKGLKNHDWEEVSLFGDSLFIGDFGNNFGNRRDLTIYSLPISGIIEGRDGFTRRSFSYSLQESYSNIPHTHRWDCESMIILEKKIILFSKDWQKQETLIYNIDRSYLNSELSPVDSLNLGFLVTGAFLERISSTLYLCGYFDGSTYIAIIDNFGESSLVAEYKKFIIKGLEGKQIESIFVMDGKIYLASEAKQVKQALYIIENAH